MKKNILFLFGTLVMSTSNFAADTLPEVIEQDRTLVPYLQGFLSASPLPKSAELFRSMESVREYKQLDFGQMLRDIFGENAWVPQPSKIRNLTLQGLFQPYAPKPPALDAEHIFFANMLYALGHMQYNDDTEKSTHIEHAASMGHAGAQYKMFFVAYGNRHYEEAKNYLFCSAAQGNIDALLNLSKVYQGYWGMGISSRLDIARLLCEEAASFGSLEAIFTLNVATFRAGTFGAQKNFRQAIVNAKQLAERNNPRAKEFLEGLKMSSADALQEADDTITEEDLDFLRDNLPGWRDTRND
jgi:hypothetical protein